MKQLETELEEASNIVDNWQESYQLLETKIAELETELANRVEEIQTLQGEKNDAIHDGDISHRSADSSGGFMVTNEPAPAPHLHQPALPLADDLKLEVENLKSKLEVSASALAELQALCDSKDTELSKLSSQLEQGKKGITAAAKASDEDNDDDSMPMQDVDFSAEINPSASPQQDNDNELTIRELSAKTTELESLVENLTKERDTATAALSSMKESSRLLRQEFEDLQAHSEESVGKWTGTF